MSALSDLEKELGLQAFDILYFKETKIEESEEKKTSVNSSSSKTNKTVNKNKNNTKSTKTQSQFDDILSNSQEYRIEKLIKSIY